jgi:hypothetical protein
VIDSILILVFSKKFRDFKRSAEVLEISHEDLIGREIVTDVIFGFKLGYEEQERDNRQAQTQSHDLRHGFLRFRELGTVLARGAL